jgi:ABC-type antimicrobial peptide transport system permease subunit
VLAAGFGVLALVLALVGIYGTATYATGRRTREIGIRMALGAHQMSLTRMFVVEGTIQAATGVVIGCGAGLALTELLESYLFGVSPTDLVTFASAAAVVAGTAALAVWLPARRAVRTDPMTTLTDDA